MSGAVATPRTMCGAEIVTPCPIGWGESRYGSDLQKQPRSTAFIAAATDAVRMMPACCRLATRRAFDVAEHVQLHGAPRGGRQAPRPDPCGNSHATRRTSFLAAWRRRRQSSYTARVARNVKIEQNEYSGVIRLVPLKRMNAQRMSE